MRRQLPTSRRDFFSGGLKKIFDKVAETADLKNPLAFLGLDRSYVRMRREIMATNFEVIFGSYESAHAQKTGMHVLDKIERFDDLMNIWQGDSELKHINQNAASEPVKVSPEIFEMITLAKQYYKETEGAFDVTSTPLSRCWGFFQRQGKVPSLDEIDKAMARLGMDDVILDAEKQTVFFNKEGIEINPASIGKGQALDHAVKVARRGKLKDVLLNGGFSSVLASGAPAWKEAWQIDIRNPFDEHKPLAKLHLKNKGFSSSGSEEQYFFHEGKRYGHIIDPRTGWPAGDILSISVAAPSAAKAEALSTAFCVMGVEKTLKYCENHKDIGVVIIPIPGKNGYSEIITSNLSDDCLEVIRASCQTKNHAII